MEGIRVQPKEQYDAVMFESLCLDMRTLLSAVRYETELLQHPISKDELELAKRRVMLHSLALSDLSSSYLVYREAQNNSELSMTGVSLSSLLYEVSDKLQAYAKQENCSFAIDVRSRSGPIYGNREALRASLMLLGYECIRAVSEQAKGKMSVVRWTVRTKKDSVVAGIYGDFGLSAKTVVKRIYKEPSSQKQPLTGFSTGRGTGLLIVRRLLDVHGVQLKPSTHKHLSGFSLELNKSTQLSLV